MTKNTVLSFSRIRIYLLKTEIQRLLLISVGFGFLLLLVLLQPFQYANAWGMIGCFSAFLSILYMALKKPGNAINI